MISMLDKLTNSLLQKTIRELRKLNDSCRELKEAVQAIKKQEDAENTREKIPLPIDLRSELRLPVSVTEYCKAENDKRKSWWPKFKTFLEMVGIASAFSLAILTYWTLREIQKQTPEIARSAKAAEDAAGTAKNELELSERPWVDADIRVNAPLTFNVNGANVTVMANLQNSGHTPAFNTQINPRLMAMMGGNDPFQVKADVCSQAIRMASTTIQYGFTVFPGRTVPEQWTVTLSNADIEEVHKRWHQKPQSDILGLQLIMCIAYRPTFNKTSVYTTAYIFNIFRFDDRTKMTLADFPIGKEVDTAHLILRPDLGGISAN